jgi:Tfp pilus assembly protein PilF
MSIHYFIAELLYKNGKCLESIDELYKSTPSGIVTLDASTGVAANYLKLGDNEKARTFIEKIGENDLYDDALAHYYESSKSKEKAIELYEKIIAVEIPRQHVFLKLL